jgi:carboxymethylenebutenolidase
MKDQITISGHDGAFRAYIARPEALPAPAVVVLQELFGVNADIREKCEELAEQGFIAVAPDLFLASRAGRRPQRPFRARLAARSSPLSLGQKLQT